MHDETAHGEVGMSDQGGSPTIPAAWYQDPGDPRQLRYWDGRNWSHQTAPLPQPVAPVATHVAAPVQQVSAPAQQPAAAAPQSYTAQPNYQAQQVAERPVFADLFDQPQQSVYTPMDFSESEHSLTSGVAGWSPNTVTGWLYAVAPALLAVLALMPLPKDLLNASDLPVRAATVLSFCVVCVLLAGIDRVELRRREYLRSPPAVLGLLPPAFSIARLASVGRRSLGLAAVSLLVQGAVAGLLYFHFAAPLASVPTPTATDESQSSVGLVPPFTDAQKAALLTPQGMAEKIKFDAAGSALRYQSVTCEPLTSTELGSQVMCTAIGKLADYDIYVQLIPTADGVPFTVMSVVPSLKI
jgi:hypothetical protein